jgi:hypothetical protein
MMVGEAAGMARRGRRGTDELVTVEDVWGRSHTVPRAWLSDARTLLNDPDFQEKERERVKNRVKEQLGVEVDDITVQTPVIIDLTRDGEALFRGVEKLTEFDLERIGRGMRLNLQGNLASLGARGGHAGKGGVKRPHSELIRRAVALLLQRKAAVTATAVRTVLKLRWEQLLDYGDPLRDIVDVAVPLRGPVRIEYTAKWAVEHLRRDIRFVELDSDALRIAIKRAVEIANRTA